MLTNPTPFPQVGAWALYCTAIGKLEAVRIVGRDGLHGIGNALISFPARTGASGNATVPLADLLDPTPCSEAERAEASRLQAAQDARRRAGKSVTRRAMARVDALRLRDIHAQKLADLLRAMGSTRMANPASRAAARAAA
jgi:hypothetical protein